MAEQWEYKVMHARTYGELQDSLNRLGGEGWELVNFQYVSGSFQGFEGHVVATLKRRKTQADPSTGE